MAKGTKRKILDTGLMVWKVNPLGVNAYAIARVMGITHGAVLYHFPTSVRDAVAEHAVEMEDRKIIAQLITANHSSICHLSVKERLDYLMNF